MGWGGYIQDPERWARDNLKDSSLWQYLAYPWTVYEEWDPDTATVDRPKKWNVGVLFDVVELLHRDAAALVGTGENDYDREGGARAIVHRVAARSARRAVAARVRGTVKPQKSGARGRGIDRMSSWERRV